MSEASEDLFQLIDIDDETLEDFMCSLYEGLELVEHDLVTLTHDPSNEETINSLFRSVHSIKGNCRMCFIDPLSDYTHAIEEMISDIRAKRLQFTPHIKEATLLALDQLRMSAESLAQTHQLDLRFLKQISARFRKMCELSPQDVELEAANVIKLISGDAAEDIPLTEKKQESIQETSNKAASEDQNSDLLYFKTLALHVDRLSPFWDSRTERILGCCVSTNAYLNIPVDTTQLTAAVYLHDIGMAFLPEALINKRQKLNPMEEKQMRRHPDLAYQMAHRIPGWEEAALMVLQHHERPSGLGYPNGLKGDAISIGAQLIAIADTFFSITNERADRTYKRSLLRAITEINSVKGTQFCDEAVDAFNDMIRNMYANKKG